MRKKSLVTTALAAGLLLGSAVPGHAATADHCLEPPYTESVPYCACILVGTVSNIVFPGAWGCAKP